MSDARKWGLFPWTGPISLLLHGLVVAALLLHWHGWLWPAAAPPPTPTFQVEYVNQFAQQKGAPPTPAAKPTPPAKTSAPTPPPTPAPAAAAQAAPPTPPPPPPAPDGELPQKPPPAPIAQAPATPPPQPAAPPAQPSPASSEPVVNLGNGDEDREPLLVTGDNVVSSGPDARYRNMPPNYPRDAARRREHGTVVLLVHVTPDGQAGEIDTVSSSGSDSLDNAARNAVSLWHFNPVVQNGVNIASEFPIRINFRDDR
jgi:periplasmic protein TonB